MNVSEQVDFVQKCTGCFACTNMCPINVIVMKKNSEGFFYPEIDKNACIDCGKCIKSCPINNHFKNDFIPQSCYSYQGEDEIRRKSSSGGAFYLLAKSVLKKAGVVFGAYFDSEEMLVKHGSTDEVSLERLMRSKYVQSKIEDCYCKVEAELKKNRYVLFCGTPCQIYGLKEYLHKEYDKLITVDFVCHGVPSTGLFQDMVKSISLKTGTKCLDVTFREKDLGWREQVIKFYFDNGTEQTYVSSSYYYYYYFLHNITLRNSCYQCQFPENHSADITLMDYWQMKEDDNKGVSAVTANTQKGQNVLYRIFDKNLQLIDFNLIKSGFVTHDKIGAYRKYHKLRDCYMQYYAKKGFESTVLKKNRKIDLSLFIIGKISIYGGKAKLWMKKCLRW